MNKITEYKIVMGLSLAELTVEVNKMLTDGWIPTGGVTMTSSPVTKQMGAGMVAVETYSFQPMIKLKTF